MLLDSVYRVSFGVGVGDGVSGGTGVGGCTSSSYVSESDACRGDSDVSGYANNVIHVIHAEEVWSCRPLGSDGVRKNLVLHLAAAL